MDFKEIVEKRYATKKFTGELIPEDKINELLEMIRMAPSSFGLQPWKIKIVKDKETKERLLEHTMNHPQVTTCSHLLVFCADPDRTAHIDRYEAMMKEAGAPEEGTATYIGIMRGFNENLSPDARKAWAQRQTYLAIGNALNGAKALGFDSCPMEGFLPDKYAEVLNLPGNLVPTALVTVGIAADEPRPKMRFSKEEMFF